MTPQLYEREATVDRPLCLVTCSWAVKPRWGEPRQCSRKVREVIEGHGYCHPHAKMVRP